MAADFTNDQMRLLRGLVALVEEFRDLRENIPSHQIEMVQGLAVNEGRTQKFYSDDWGMPPATVSRAFLDLGRKNRKGDDGLGLVEGRVSAHSLKEHEVYLATKGRSLLRRVLKGLSR
jgi:hypothetical protein